MQLSLWYLNLDCSKLQYNHCVLTQDAEGDAVYLGGGLAVVHPALVLALVSDGQAAQHQAGEHPGHARVLKWTNIKHKCWVKVSLKRFGAFPFTEVERRGTGDWFNCKILLRLSSSGHTRVKNDFNLCSYWINFFGLNNLNSLNKKRLCAVLQHIAVFLQRCMQEPVILLTYNSKFEKLLQLQPLHGNTAMTLNPDTSHWYMENTTGNFNL